MNNSTDDATAGPSTVKDVEATSSEKLKRVMFARRSSIRSSVQEPDSSYRRRQSSIIGTAGYVSEMIEELQKDEMEVPFEKEVRKPIRKQSTEERKQSIKEMDANIKYYMKSVARMSIAGEKKSSEKLPTMTKEKVQEVKSMTEAKIAESRSEAEWLPSEILGSQPGDKIERSWVGTYVVGKDYWKPREEDESEKETRKAKHRIDEDKKQWYEIPAQKTSLKEDAEFLKMKKKSLELVETLKHEMDSEFLLKRKERLISAAKAREKAEEYEEWTDNFKVLFQNAAKTTFSPQGTHISMVDADKWLEKAGILDYDKLTLIHTGLCFLASGGTRKRGLTFKEFTHYLQMISYTTGMPLRDITKRLEICLRNVPPKEL